MKRHHQPSGVHHGIDLLIDPHWSPDQALAVIELLDDLRERIWSHYQLALLTTLREERVPRSDVPMTDPPF
jgi:hypothetical protein